MVRRIGRIMLFKSNTVQQIYHIYIESYKLFCGLGGKENVKPTPVAKLKSIPSNSTPSLTCHLLTNDNRFLISGEFQQSPFLYSYSNISSNFSSLNGEHLYINHDRVGATNLPDLGTYRDEFLIFITFLWQPPIQKSGRDNNSELN